MTKVDHYFIESDRIFDKSYRYTLVKVGDKK